MKSEGLEVKLKSKIRKSKIQKIILNSLYIAGAVSIAILAPNVLSVLKQFNKGKIQKGNQKYAVTNAVARLKEKGLVAWVKNEKGVFLQLTKQGEQVLGELEKREFNFSKPNKWDGKWRIIIFDITESRRRTRDMFRKTLVQIGFLRLQNSVWVYPYDCEELIALLKADLKTGKDILYIIADSIENDIWIKKHFGFVG